MLCYKKKRSNLRYSSHCLLPELKSGYGYKDTTLKHRNQVFGHFYS
nr:MAG TPA: hypothetical protein [Crassvirales sp.]